MGKRRDPVNSKALFLFLLLSLGCTACGPTQHPSQGDGITEELIIIVGDAGPKKGEQIRDKTLPEPSETQDTSSQDSIADATAKDMTSLPEKKIADLPTQRDVPTGLPDVQVIELRWQPEKPKVGQLVKFYCRIRNNGGPTGKNVGVTYTVNGKAVGWGVEGPMKGGETKEGFWLTKAWPATAGSIVVKAISDDVNRFKESDENNNTLQRTFFVEDGQTGAFDMARYVISQDPTQRVFHRLKRPTGGTADEVFAYRDGGTFDGLKRWFFVKNVSGENWEEFGFDSKYVYRYRDSSWANTCQDGSPAFYFHKDDDRKHFGRWVKRYMKPGETFISPVQSVVDAGYKRVKGCSMSCRSKYEGKVTIRVKFVKHHPSYSTIWKLVIKDVVELRNVNAQGQPHGDRFFYAKGLGLVGFEGPNANDKGIWIGGAYRIAKEKSGPKWVSLCGK